MNDRQSSRREVFYSYPNETSRFIECPRCGKKTLYQRNADQFVCLSCTFKRDLSKPTKQKSFLPTLLMLLTLIIVVLIILSR